MVQSLVLGPEIFTKRVVKYWNRLPREIGQSPSLEVLKRCVALTLGVWFSGGLGSARLMVELRWS